MEPVEKFVVGTHGRLHFLDWGGDGPLAHLLHANGFCAGTYSPFVAALGPALHLTASDIRGHGDSAFIETDRIVHWKVFAEDLKDIVEGVMTPPVIGMGHSLGAVTAYIAAAAYPHLFSALVLMDPVVLPRHLLWMIRILKALGLAGAIPLARGARRRRRSFRDRKEALARFAAGRGIFKSWEPAFIDAYLECGLLEKDDATAVLKCDPETEARIFESVPLDVWTYAKGIRCPVLMVRGEFSEAFRPGQADRLARRITDCRLETIAGAGHFIPMEKPGELAALILDFLADCRVCRQTGDGG
ncbi:MAG: alpha/beta hydrolase [Desulfobacterales bacterium]|nr:alpha/beta hydrolase [Desulfobacterales bacterium]